jgi:hypothetical protein
MSVGSVAIAVVGTISPAATMTIAPMAPSDRRRIEAGLDRDMTALLALFGHTVRPDGESYALASW